MGEKKILHDLRVKGGGGGGELSLVVCESVKWVEKVTPSRLLLVVGLCPSPWRWYEGERTYYALDSIRWSVCKCGLLGFAGQKGVGLFGRSKLSLGKCLTLGTVAG